MLIVHIAHLTARPESERCGNVGQNRHRKRSAQSAKKASLADADLDWQFRHEIDDGGDPGSDSLHAAAQPADRPRQCHLRPANQIGGGRPPCSWPNAPPLRKSGSYQAGPAAGLQESLAEG
jgi:hypothetical protein